MKERGRETDIRTDELGIIYLPITDCGFSVTHFAPLNTTFLQKIDWVLRVTSKIPLNS